MSRAYNQYNSLPSHRLVLIIKDCKLLLDKRPDYSVELKNTIMLIRDILIKRQRL